jgi:putative sigma-54 modulation protein
LKARTKFRDAKRIPHKSAPEVETETAPAEGEGDSGEGRQVYKVKPAQKRKPMTVEEAVMEMDKTKDYLVYRDAQTDRVSVLVRRRDGHFDLVEG